MKDNKKYLLIAFILIGTFISAQVFAVTLQGYNGGTGMSTSTSANDGNCLKQASSTPFLTYNLLACGSGGGGGVATASPATNFAVFQNGSTITGTSTVVQSVANTSTAGGIDFSTATGSTITAVLHSLNISQLTNDSGYKTSTSAGTGNVIVTAASVVAGYVPTYQTTASSTITPTSTLFCNTTGCSIGSSTVPQPLFVYSGTTAPFVRIQGSSDGSSFSGFELWDNAAVPNKWQFVQSSQDGPNTFEIIQNTGNRGFKFPIAITSSTDFVGINTKTPATQLDVNGDITDENVTSSVLKTDSSGKLTKAIAGTDYALPLASQGTFATTTLSYSQLLDSTTTPVIVTNTTTATTFYTYALGGNALSLGKTLRIYASGQFLDAGVLASNLKCFLLYGGTTLVGSNVTAVTTSTANAYFYCLFTLSNASGTTNTQIGTVQVGATNGGAVNSAPVSGAGTSAIDSTVSQNVVLQVSMNQKQASTTATITNVTTMLDGATSTLVSSANLLASSQFSVGTTTTSTSFIVQGGVQIAGSSSVITPVISGAIIGTGCDSATTSIDTSFTTSTTALITTPRNDPGTTVSGFYSLITAPGVLTTRVCGVGVTPNATDYVVKLIK